MFHFKVTSTSFRLLSLSAPQHPLIAVMASCTAQLDLGRSPGVNYHPPCLIFTHLFIFLSLSDSLRFVSTWLFLR